MKKNRGNQLLKTTSIKVAFKSGQTRRICPFCQIKSETQRHTKGRLKDIPKEDSKTYQRKTNSFKVLMSLFSGP